jgi:hypothetical protein
MTQPTANRKATTASSNRVGLPISGSISATIWPGKSAMVISQATTSAASQASPPLRR